MGQQFEITVGKYKKNSPKEVVNEGVTPIDEEGPKAESNALIIEQEVLKYLEHIKARNQQKVRDNISALKNKEKAERITVRTPEAEFQNSLLRLVHQNKMPLEKISRDLKVALAKYAKEDSFKMQEEVDGILTGVQSCEEAVMSLQKEMNLEHKEEKNWIATNDSIDALYKVDLIGVVEDKEGLIKVLNLVQVKSAFEDEGRVEEITNTHQGYLNALPQFIGILNKKEASSLVEKGLRADLIDIERNSQSIEQLTLFCLVLDDYITEVKEMTNKHDIRASLFYLRYKEEGGILNPFTVMGILKSPKILDQYRNDKYLEGNPEIEELLAKSADEIPFTEEESFAFHNKNHVHNILNSGKIISIVMVKGKKVSETELKHPYSKNKQLA